MIAVDTNILIYTHRKDSPWHGVADRCLTELAESSSAWAIPWPCLHEFLAIVTHPRIYDPPTPLPDALDQVVCWMESPTVALLSERTGYWERLQSLLTRCPVVGPQIHDARIAALCQLHGVTELWTADRDFQRFVGIAVVNPLS